MDLGHDQDGKISATPLELGDSGGVSIYAARLLEWCKTAGLLRPMLIVITLAWAWARRLETQGNTAQVEIILEKIGVLVGSLKHRFKKEIPKMGNAYGDFVPVTHSLAIVPLPQCESAEAILSKFPRKLHARNQRGAPPRRGARPLHLDQALRPRRPSNTAAGIPPGSYRATPIPPGIYRPEQDCGPSRVQWHSNKTPSTFAGSSRRGLGAALATRSRPCLPSELRMACEVSHAAHTAPSRHRHVPPYLKSSEAAHEACGNLENASTFLRNSQKIFGTASAASLRPGYPARCSGYRSNIPASIIERHLDSNRCITT
jgi:hypothetical protein